MRWNTDRWNKMLWNTERWNEMQLNMKGRCDEMRWNTIGCDGMQCDVEMLFEYRIEIEYIGMICNAMK